MECWPVTVPPSAGIFLGCCDSLSDGYSIFTLGLKEALWEKSAPPPLPPKKKKKKKTVSMALVVATAQIHKSRQSIRICGFVLDLINPLHSIIGIHILHSVLLTFPMILTRRICLTIRSFLNKQSYVLFSWPILFIQGWYCKEKLEASHSLALKS